MNKLKVSLQALREHLGLDRQGCRLLEQVTEIANDQRKRLALLEKEAAESRAALAMALSETKELQQQNDSLRRDLNSERSRRESMEWNLKAANEKLALLEADDTITGEEDDKPQAHAAIIKRLLKDVKTRFPKHIPGTMTDGRVFVIEDFVKTYSHTEFASLGMIVTLCSAMLGRLTVKTKTEWGKVPGVVSHEIMGQFFQWFSNRIYVDENSIREKIAQHCFAYSETVRQSEP